MTARPPSRLQIAVVDTLARWWCGLRGHSPMLVFRRPSVAVACTDCGHVSPGIVERRPPPFLSRDVAVLPPLPATALPSTLTLHAAPGVGELRVTNMLGAGQAAVARIPLTADQLLELAVSAFVGAADVSGLAHSVIGARALASRTGVPVEIAKSIADDVVARLVLHHLTPVAGADVRDPIEERQDA